MDHDELATRAELYLCLSRAFLAPRLPELAAALRCVLAGDLLELDATLALGGATHVADYGAEMQRLGGDLELLQAYSAIFVAPPVGAFINVGQYMDGAVNGGSVRGMELAYLQAGFERNEAFRDLADHLSVVLEFVALLYATPAEGAPGEQAGQFLYTHVGPWVDRFAADVARASQDKELAVNPYRPLAALLRDAVGRHAVAPVVDPLTLRHQRAMERARAMRTSRGVTQEDLEEIRRKLQARGLSTEHLPQTTAEADRRVASALGMAP